MLSTICKASYIFSKFCQKQIQESDDGKLKFDQHISKFGLRFATHEEYIFRFQIFLQKDKFIQENNLQDSLFKLDHNRFSTFTDYEIKHKLGRMKKNDQTKNYQTLNTENIPESVNWIQKGFILPIENQGQCASSIAYSSAGQIEGAHFVKTGELLQLSEQQILDCDEIQSGCSIQWKEDVFQYAKDFGLELKQDYQQGNGKTCQSDASKVKVKVEQIFNVVPNSVDQLKAAIAQVPTQVLVQADSLAFIQYSSGILNSQSCGTQVNHSLLAVGYGTLNGVDYYILKNSWGNQWGQNGFIKIAAVEGPGICGVQTSPVFTTSN